MLSTSQIYVCKLSQIQNWLAAAAIKKNVTHLLLNHGIMCIVSKKSSNCLLYKGLFTYDISDQGGGGGGNQMLTNADKGEGGSAKC